MPRGYFGVGIYRPKNADNVGTLWRSAFAFGATMIFTIGPRYRHQATDTCKTPRQVPYVPYPDWDAFQTMKPVGASLVCVEVGTKRELSTFRHPEQCLYLLGPEDGSIPDDILAQADARVYIDSRICLNVASAGTIVMYDRLTKLQKGSDHEA